MPVLAPADKALAPIADSMTITEYIAERYPELLPSAYKARLLEYMKRLHAINFFSLSFSGRKESKDNFDDVKYILINRVKNKTFNK